MARTATRHRWTRVNGPTRAWPPNAPIRAWNAPIRASGPNRPTRGCGSSTTAGTDRVTATLTVRAATPADEAGVAAIHDAAWGGPIVVGHDSLYDLTTLPTLVAVDADGAVVGALAYRTDGHGF